MKKTIEINDTLDEIVEQCKSELIEAVVEWVSDHSLKDFHKEFDGQWDTYWEACYQECASEAVGVAADSNTPIYYSEIDGLYYLYGDEFEEALQDTGIEVSNDNRRQTAICCYLSQKTLEYMDTIEEAFNNSDYEKRADLLTRLKEMQKEL